MANKKNEDTLLSNQEVASLLSAFPSFSLFLDEEDEQGISKIFPFVNLVLNIVIIILLFVKL